VLRTPVPPRFKLVPVADPIPGVTSAKDAARSDDPTVLHVGADTVFRARTNWLLQAPVPGIEPGMFEPVTGPVAATDVAAIVPVPPELHGPICTSFIVRVVRPLPDIWTSYLLQAT
jgi:hypothetical protein